MSGELTERIGDEEMYGVMQACVTRMHRVVEAHDGTVTQFRGDGIMALFGAPLALEDAAIEAVSAALEMQASLIEYGEELSSRVGAGGCRFRIGVNTGPVVVGRVGDDTLVDYTAIGDTANVAARLEEAAGPGEVVIADTTWRAVRDYVDCEELGGLELKGKQDAVGAYRAMRRRPVRTRLDAAGTRGLSPFVGRDDELGLLDSFVSHLAEGRGRVVAVAGEAGVGKSRLLRELRGRLPEEVSWFEGQSSAADRGAPWHLMVDLLRRTFEIGEHDSPGDIARIVDERARRWSENARSAAPYLTWLLGAPEPDIAGLDPQERRAGILEALVTTLRDAATRRPVVVCLEDLHWADEASEAGVAALANAVADVPVMLALTYRPEGAPDLADRPWFTRLALDGLPADAASALAAASVGAALSDDARRLIVDRAGGNALFVEELAASLIEGGAVELRDGVLDVAGNLDRPAVPASLQEVVLARIGRLDNEPRRALQLASVIGREFTHRILDRIAQMPERLDTHLVELESLELIRQRSWFPELGYLFKHAVVHDVTYSTLLDERRRELHRVVALATEELYAETVQEHCESLARHWLAAGDEERALPHLATAGDRAVAGFSMARAIDAYDQAADIAERLGRPHEVIRLRTHRLNALQATSDLDGVLGEAERILQVAQTVNDTGAQSFAIASRAMTVYLLHDFDAAVDAAVEATQLGWRAFESGDSADGLLVAGFVRCGVHAVHGRLDEVDAVLAELEPVMQSSVGIDVGLIVLARENWRADWGTDPALLSVDAPLEYRLHRLWVAGGYAAGRGDYLKALDLLHQGLALCERVGELLVKARILNTIGWVHGDLGDTTGALEWNERSISTVAPAGLPDREIEGNARLNLADDSLAEGRLDDTATQLTELERTIRDPTPPEEWMLWRYSQRWLCIAGELALARGDPAAALAFADECLPRSEQTESRKYIVRARRLRAQVLAALDRPGEAQADLDAAVDLAREIANPPQLWRTLIAAAELEGTDDRPHAHEALDVIDRVITELGDHPLAQSLRDSADRSRAAALDG